MANTNWNKAKVGSLLSHLASLLEKAGKAFGNVDVFEDQQGALASLQGEDEDIEDENDIARFVADLNIDKEIAEMEQALKDMKAYQALVKANKARISNWVESHLAECPKCGAKFNKDSL